MKKIFSCILIILVLSVSGCYNSKKLDLIFSEYVEGYSLDSICALEIYNPTKGSIELKDYKLGVYRNGEDELTLFDLTGVIKSKEVFVISDKNIENVTDLVLPDLSFNGNDPIVLKNKSKVISTIGYLGSYGSYFGKDVSMVKVDVEKNLYNSEYVVSDWFNYGYDVYDNLGTIEHQLSIDDILDGPLLTETAKNTPFFPEGITKDNYSTARGTGGAVEVKLKTCGDGDTTYFNYPQEFYDLGLNSNDNRVRYYAIDTPESGGSTGSQYQEFGNTAKAYVCNLLTNAETIHIRSIENGPMFETYGRILAFVYVDGVLLNNKIIQKGYSDVNNVSVSYNFLDNNIPILSYLNFSYEYALYNKLGRHGEKDPLWDYEAGKPKDRV